MLCGTPGTGIHATRIFGFAFWDIFATVAAAFLLNKIAFGGRSFWIVLLVLVAAGVFVHRKMGIQTALNKKLFGP
jgi:hypothetical protein